MPRRKPGTLLPLETDILVAALSTTHAGEPGFHGFGLARTLGEQSGARALTAHGTLYKALGRLEEFGMLTSDWEDAAAAEGRPRRRIYSLTARGSQIAEQAATSMPTRPARSRPSVRPEPA